MDSPMPENLSGSLGNLPQERLLFSDPSSMSDQTIRLSGVKALKYPLPLRRVIYRDSDTYKRYIFLTNYFPPRPPFVKVR